MKRPFNGIHATHIATFLAFVIAGSTIWSASIVGAYRFDPGIEVSVLGEDGSVEQTCSVAFDTYLLQSSTWESRISNFAEQALKEIASKLVDYAFCAIPEVQSSEGGGIVIANVEITTEIVKRPECTWQLSGGDVAGILEDNAKRQLTYDSIMRCTSRTVLDDLIDKMLRIVRENGRDGGSTWVRDYSDLIDDAEARGRAIARNVLGNSQQCQWNRDIMESAFGYDEGGEGPSLESVENGDLPRSQQMQCSFGPDADLQDVAEHPLALQLLANPRNNLWGAYLSAMDEFAYQVEKQRTADLAEAAPSGYLGSRGTNEEESCAQYQDNTCVDLSDIVQPGSNLAEIANEANRAEIQWIVTSDAMGDLIGDMRYRVLSRIQSLDVPDVHFGFEPDPAQRRYLDDPGTGTDPGPTTACTQTVGAAGYCGMPNQSLCTCLHPETLNACEPTRAGDGQAADQYVKTSVRGALGAVANDLRAGPPPYTGAAGVRFVQEVCLELFGQNLSYQNCHPRNTGNEVLLVINYNGNQLLVDVIRADGAPRVNDPTPKYACSASVGL